ncbi:tRNA-guanine(15) transglycosylase-like protein, partial [Baffinella frigidus]
MGGATAPPAFEVVSKSGEARRGCLKGKIETPAPLLYTRRGFPPPLTLRELDALAQTSLPGKEGDTGISSGGAGRALALQINAADFFEQDNRGAVMAKCEGGVRRFCGLGERDHLVLLTHRDALNLQTGMPASDGWVTMQTPGGQLKVTADEYVKFVGSAAPDVAVCLSDEVSADSSDKRVKKSIDRSAEWTSKCLAAREAGVIPASTLLLAPVLGGIFERERSKSAADAALSAADGYAISGLGGWESPAQRASLVALTIAALDGGKPRVLLGVGNPLEVLESVALGVDLVETAYPYTVAAQGLAITFPVELDAIMAAAANTPPRAEPGPGQQGGKLNLRDSELRKDGRPLVE